MTKMRLTAAIGVCVVSILSAAGIAETTQVKVLQGKVLAQTDKGTVAVAPGQKAVLSQEDRPIVVVNDPLVEEVIKKCSWTQAEKQAVRTRIDSTSIRVISVDDENTVRAAALAEIPNATSTASTACRIGVTSLADDQTFYDLKGNLIPFRVEKVSETTGYYHLDFPDPVGPGEHFKLVSVGRTKPTKEYFWSEDHVWRISAPNETPYCLDYLQVVLPKSAILVDASLPAAVVNEVDDRVAVTTRKYYGKTADGFYWDQISFLWPEKDGTTLADLPPEYRGLRDQRDLELAEEYHREKAKILAGGKYQDQSNPVRALLTYTSALVNRDMDLLMNVTYTFHKHPEFTDRITEQFWDVSKRQFVDQTDFLSTPAWPESPQNGTLHAVYTCRPGSLIRQDMFAFVYYDGKWYQLGNEGNPRGTDVSAFTKFLQ
jgi:hypothetical protein